MGISKKMSGVSWQIEKVKGYSKTRKNCLNCKYIDGHWCTRNHIQITNNNADVCKIYRNKSEEKKPKQIEPSSPLSHKDIKKDKVIKKSQLVDIKQQLNIIPTTMQIETTIEIIQTIENQLFKNGKYNFNGFMEIIDDRSTNLLSRDITSIIFISEGMMLRCRFKRNSIDIIKSGNYLTIFFTLYSIFEDNLHLSKPFRIMHGIDTLYGSISFYRSQKIHQKYKNCKRNN